MGGSASCLLYPSSTPKRHVMVMKDDGVMLRFKEGSHVKDVLIAHPCHKVIKCCSDGALLPDSFQLSCNQLYFLLPKTVALYDKTIKRLLRIAASNDPTFSMLSYKRDDQRDANTNKEISTNMGLVSKSDDDSSRYFKSRWKPALKTIPELTLSEILHAEAKAKAKAGGN